MLKNEGSKRSYGCLNELMKQHKILKEKFKDLVEKKDKDKWLKICLNVELYTGCEDIIHFALCCFVKIPLEATAESIGSVINRHGRKERCSLRPDVLSSECQISWNGPSEFSKEASDLIDESIEDHFKNNK